MAVTKNADYGYKVFGPTLIHVSFDKGTNWEELGTVQQDFDLRITEYLEPIMIDTTGGSLPGDYQYMGKDCHLGLPPLVVYSENTLEKIIEKHQGQAGGADKGASIARGTVMIDAERYVQVAISGTGDTPWKFLYCLLEGHSEGKGTRRAALSIDFHAFEPYLKTTSGAGTTAAIGNLYKREALA